VNTLTQEVVMSDIKPSELLINKVQTTADGGARVTFDFNPDDLHIIKLLMEKKLSGNDLVKCVFIDEKSGKVAE
jgi:hypothetical protein